MTISNKFLVSQILLFKKATFQKLNKRRRILKGP